MEALRGRKYQLIAMAAIVAVVAAGVVGTLADANKLLPERYHQHEKAQKLADLPEADRAAASGTNTDAATFASHLPVVSIDTGGQEIPGELVRDENGKTIEGEDGRAVVTAVPSGRICTRTFGASSRWDLLGTSTTCSTIIDWPRLLTSSTWSIARGTSCYSKTRRSPSA